MVNARPQGKDSTESLPVGPLRDSFLRHLAAENKSPSTRATYAKAVCQFGAFLTATGRPDGAAAVRRADVSHS
jgi:hypothetical protein